MKARLAILYFLQFAVWGSYLTSFGQLLGAGGLGRNISWFYAAVGMVSMLTPALMGHIADRLMSPARLLGLCHAAAAVTMLGAWHYASVSAQLDMWIFYPLYVLFLTFYMPTMALANTTAFGVLKSRGIMPVDAFPQIRVWGTVGFVAAMWLVNSTYVYDGALGWTMTESHPAAHLRFQYNAMQLLCAGVFGLLTAAYAFSLPHFTRTDAGNEQRPGLFSRGVLGQFFGIPRVRLFLIFAAFTGVCLQISNGFVTSFITHFSGLKEYARTFASGNATMLFSISQISEALCILLVGRSMKRWGIGTVFAIGILSWSFRFAFLGLGNPGEGLWLLVASMLVYGIGFNFVTIAGHLYVEQVSPSGSKGLGQGVMMLMSNGVGATVGIVVAGEVINHWCRWESVAVAPGAEMHLFMGEWIWPWLIFAGYAALVAVAWMALFGLKRKDTVRTDTV